MPTSTELQGFHHYQGKYNSAQEHSQETQIPIHPNSLSPTRQEHTILSSYAAARLLGIISIINSLLLAAYHKAHIYTCYFIKSAPGIPNTTCISSISMIGLGLVRPYELVAIQATRAHFNKSPPWLELIKLHEQTPPLPPP